MPWWLLDYRVWMAAAIVGIAIYAKVQNLEKQQAEATLAQFRADVESEAAKAKVAAAQETARRALAAQEVLDDLQARNAALRARYDRLRSNPGGPSSLSALSSAAPSLGSCPGEPSQPDAAAGRLDQVEAVIARILEDGDKEIAKLVELYRLQLKNSGAAI